MKVGNFQLRVSRADMEISNLETPGCPHVRVCIGNTLMERPCLHQTGPNWETSGASLGSPGIPWANQLMAPRDLGHPSREVKLVTKGQLYFKV